MGGGPHLCRLRSGWFLERGPSLAPGTKVSRTWPCPFPRPSLQCTAPCTCPPSTSGPWCKLPPLPVEPFVSSTLLMVLAREASLCASPVPRLHHTLPRCSFLPPHAHLTHGIAWAASPTCSALCPMQTAVPWEQDTEPSPQPPISSLLPSFHPLHPFVPPTPPSLRPLRPLRPLHPLCPSIRHSSGCQKQSLLHAFCVPPPHSTPFPPDRPPCSSVW